MRTEKLLWVVVSFLPFAFTQARDISSNLGNYNKPIEIGRHHFIAEVVSSWASMQRGMMYRPRIDSNQAMLFVYPRPQRLSFWMKNMQIPLDILFFDQHGILQEIKANVPPCQIKKCPIYPALQDDNQFVVEIQAGLSAKLGIQVGDKLSER